MPPGFSILLLLVLAFSSPAEDFSELCAARAAVERVYYQHRLGDKPLFEKTLPRATLELLVRNDLRKEMALRKTYGVEVTPAMFQAELQRINASTRAPDVLAELKAALGNDEGRFVQTVIKPIIVERLLRSRFENDAGLHAPQRREMERVREQLLAIAAPELVERRLALLRRSYSNDLTESCWLFRARPTSTHVPAADEPEIQQRLDAGSKTRAAARQEGHERQFFFDDLPGELQRVLRAQLRQAGDVSAVIETPESFLLYLVKERTTELLNVATLSFPKQDFEQWLTEHSALQP